jgi:hypothetical protein
MNRNISGFVKVAASLSLAGGILAAAALPAAAAAPNYAYAVNATGLVTLGPLGYADYPGTSPVSVVNANVAGVLTAGAATETADATSASSTIASLGVGLSALVNLSTGIITSSCSLDTDSGDVTGTSTIANGTITGLLGGTVDLATNPTVDEFVTPAGLSAIATIELNRQVTAGDGTLTVDAIYITLLSGETITVAESTCNSAVLAAVPVLPTKTLAFSIGGLGLLLMGGLGYQVSRRRRQSAAAA